LDKELLREQLSGIINSYLESQGLALVDLVVRYEGNNLSLKIFADRPQGGITLDECAMINKYVGNILDEKELIGEKYILEVSSPGLDRPLRTKNDFLRCLGKKAVFFLKEPVCGKLELRGIITEASDDLVKIDAGDGILEIPIINIGKSKQDLN